MHLLSATQNGQRLQITSEGSAHFISLAAKQPIGSIQKIKLLFEGKPVVAINPPWDGGWTWQKDLLGKPFIANANQGIGASVWWPNKDHPYDEVDSLDLKATIPQGLMAVSNGRLVDSISAKAGTMTYHWTVKNPINNYGVNINIADYAHFTDSYNGEKGKLNLDFYVLKQNRAKAKKQFAQVPDMLEAFEYWMGPYPFYEDSYKLVEVPYLGMEHQSSVTYGNKYANGYLGRDLSGSGWGDKFDYIIIHESAHEWFANNITNNDVADIWIQEGFTTYAENLFVDYHFGKKASSEYVLGQRKLIRNDRPIIGIYGVNYEGSGDMYFKGANILNSLRYIIDDDEKWRKILRGIGSTFYHQTVSSATLENYISEQSGSNLKTFFDQYLRTTKVPKLEYKIEENIVHFRYTNIENGFNAPVDVNINGSTQRILPTEKWKELSFGKDIKDFVVNPNFYIETEATN
jgi:aminopeptidase N